MKKVFLILLIFSFKISSQSYFKSINQLEAKLDSIGAMTDAHKRDSVSQTLITNLKMMNKIPFTSKVSVLFIYNGVASSVYWAGDFTGWGTNPKQFSGVKKGISNIWTAEAIFPPDARLDYKVF